jgi:iron complex outermembrane recepter protein
MDMKKRNLVPNIPENIMTTGTFFSRDPNRFHVHCHFIIKKKFLSLLIFVFFFFGATPSYVNLAKAEYLSSADTLTTSELKQMSLQDLMNIEVTSVSLRPEKISQSPSAIQVITGDEIQRSGASNLPEALRLADNLEVDQKGSHQWGVSARGFNTDFSNKLLVMIDGRTVYTPLFSGVFWDQQDYLLEDIDRIEVVSGPGGTLWGANAVNGVINIITKSAENTQGLYLEGGGGTQLQDFTGLRYGGTIGSNIFYRAYGKYFSEGDEALTNGNDASDSWKFGQGGFRIDANASPADALTLQGDYYNGSENDPTGNMAGTNGGNILGHFSHTFSEKSDISLQLYYDRTHWYDPTPARFGGANNSTLLAPAGVFKDDLDTYDASMHYRLQLGDRNRIVWGLGYRFTRDQNVNSPFVAFEPTPLDQKLYSGFLQDELSILDNLILTAGSKLEHNDYTGYEVEPSARLQWNFIPDQMLWAAVSRAVRTPSRVDRDEQIPLPAFAPLGIPYLQVDTSTFVSETVIAYEIGYRAQLNPMVTTSLSTFYNDYNDLRSTSETPLKVFPFFFQNNLTGQTYGAELTIDLQMLQWWQLHAGYDFLKELIHVKPGQIDLSNALNETADPENQASLRSSMNLPQNIEFDLNFRWVDKLPTNNNGVVEYVPSYAELDARLGWRPIDKLEISIVGQNLLHDRHLEYFVSPPSPTEEIRRSAYAKISLWL